MNVLDEKAEITLYINGNAISMPWTTLASTLTSFPCTTGECATDVASNASLDVFWILLMSILVLFIPFGLILSEMGSISKVSQMQNSIVHVVAVLCVTALSFYSIGFGLASFTGNEIYGTNGFAFTGSIFQGRTGNLGYNLAYWFYQWTTVATVVSLVAGALAERTQLMAYLLYAFIISAVAFPLILHWFQTDEGWASPFQTSDRFLKVGVIDYSGGGAIALTASAFALVGSLIVGPRTGRFDSRGYPVDLPQQSAALQTVGTIMIWIGFYGIAGGASLTLAGKAAAITARVMINLTLAASVGGVTGLVLGKFMASEAFDPIVMNHGIVAALVGISPGCATMEAYSAIVVGFIAVLAYFASYRILLRLQIDDVTHIISILFLPGLWGMLAAGLFTSPTLYAQVYRDEPDFISCGLFYTCRGRGLQQLLANFLFGVVTFGWSAIFAFLTFMPLQIGGLLRVDDDRVWTEKEGEEEFPYVLSIDSSSRGGESYSTNHDGSSYTHRPWEEGGSSLSESDRTYSQNSRHSNNSNLSQACSSWFSQDSQAPSSTYAARDSRYSQYSEAPILEYDSDAARESTEYSGFSSSTARDSSFSSKFSDAPSTEYNGARNSSQYSSPYSHSPVGSTSTVRHAGIHQPRAMDSIFSMDSRPSSSQYSAATGPLGRLSSGRRSHHLSSEENLVSNSFDDDDLDDDDLGHSFASNSSTTKFIDGTYKKRNGVPLQVPHPRYSIHTRDGQYEIYEDRSSGSSGRDSSRPSDSSQNSNRTALWRNPSTSSTRTVVSGNENATRAPRNVQNVRNGRDPSTSVSREATYPRNTHSSGIQSQYRSDSERSSASSFAGYDPDLSLRDTKNGTTRPSFVDL